MKQLSGKLGLISKAAYIFFHQYHGRIPSEMLRRYVHKYRHERYNINTYGQRYFNPEVPEEYQKWLTFQEKKPGSPVQADVLHPQTVLSLKEIHTDMVLVEDGENIFYPDMYGFLERADDADLIYSDFDHIDENGRRYEPHCEPDFSYDTLRGFNYFGPCFLVKTELLKQFEGQPWDPYYWLLELSKQHLHIRHISHILYGTKESETNGYASLQKSLKDIPCTIEKNKDGITNTVHYQVTGKPLVSIIIPTRDGVDVLDTCLQSVFKDTSYPSYEIIICDNDSREMASLDYFSKIQKEHSNVHVVKTPGSFNYSRINNLGVKASHGDYIVLLNNDTSIITKNWLEEMLGYAQQDHIGAVGVTMYYPDTTIQHAGVIAGKGGGFAHRYYRCPRDIHGYDHTLDIPYDLSCVTAACLMVSRKKFDRISGLNEELTVQFNDADFCLRLYEQGYFNIYLPQVKLFHYESKSRGLDRSRKSMERFRQEVDYAETKWHRYLKHDPFYNDQYDKNYDYRLIAGTGSN